jgi:hypothetical protein
MMKMSLEGFTEYKRREFCKDVKCPVQMELNLIEKNSEAYQKLRQTCVNTCRYTTFEFHHWLIEKGYLILKPESATEKRS